MANQAKAPGGEGRPQAYVRLERSEPAFVAACGSHVDGVVVAGRFDAPHWPDSRAAKSGLTGSELKRDVLEAHLNFILDPETWYLPHLDGLEDRSLGRAARMPCAAAVPLPLKVQDLDDDSLERLTRSVLRAQVGAICTIAPYFMVRDPDDPWLGVNLRAIQMSRKLSRGRAVAATIRVPLETVESGHLSVIASRYAKALAPGATVFLTVCDLQPSTEVSTLNKYFAAVADFAALGLQVVLDRAAEVCVPAVAIGAAGAVLGTRLYRTTGESPRWTNNFNPRIRLKYATAGRCDRLPIEAAQRRTRKGSIKPCRDPSCAVLKGKTKNLEIRLHNAHWLRFELAHAAQLGSAGLSQEMKALGLKRLVAWAQALDDAAALSQAA